MSTRIALLLVLTGILGCQALGAEPWDASRGPASNGEVARCLASLKSSFSRGGFALGAFNGVIVHHEGVSSYCPLSKDRYDALAAGVKIAAALSMDMKARNFVAPSIHTSLINEGVARVQYDGRHWSFSRLVGRNEARSTVSCRRMEDQELQARLRVSTLFELTRLAREGGEDDATKLISCTGLRNNNESLGRMARMIQAKLLDNGMPKRLVASEIDSDQGIGE